MTQRSELEHALQILAYVVVRHGDQYGCLLERVQDAIDELDAAPDHRSMAQRILARSMQQGVRSAPAV